MPMQVGLYILDMKYYDVKDIRAEQPKVRLIQTQGQTLQYELVSEAKLLDRVRYNSFLEHLECYFRNTKEDVVGISCFNKTPTITMNRKVIDGTLSLCWITISESLLHQICWSTEALNVYMFNHGIPSNLIQILKVMESNQIALLAQPGLSGVGSVQTDFQMEDLGVTTGKLWMSWNQEGAQTRFEMTRVSNQFRSLMAPPHLSKEKKKEIKKVFKF